MTELDFDIHFGPVVDKKVNWRDVLIGDEPDDDEELDVTPADVIGILGFDPKELEGEIVPKDIGLSTVLKIGNANSGNHGHRDRPGHVGGSGGGNPSQAQVTTANDLARDSFTVEETARLYQLQTATNDLQKSYDLDSSGNKASSQALLYERLKDNKDFVDMIDSAYRGNRTELSTEEVAKIGIRNLVDGWAGTSADTNPNSIAMQMAVREEFKAKDSYVPYEVFDPLQDATPKVGEIAFREAQKIYVKQGKGLRAFARAEYEETQQYLKDKDIKELFLYRGVGESGVKGISLEDQKHGGHDIDVRMMPISSFSLSSSVAWMFAGSAVLVGVVPRERIFSTPRTGIGCTNEGEVVVLGGKTRLTSISNESNALGLFGRGGSLSSKEDVDVQTLLQNLAQSKKKAAKPSIISNIDEDLNDADWAKNTWDLPEYGSKEFNKYLESSGMALAKFKQLPVYKWAKERGDIND